MVAAKLSTNSPTSILLIITPSLNTMMMTEYSISDQIFGILITRSIGLTLFPVRIDLMGDEKASFSGRADSFAGSSVNPYLYPYPPLLYNVWAYDTFDGFLGFLQVVNLFKNIPDFSLN